MAQFDDLTITNNGLDMIALSQAGAKLFFTKIKLGDGQIEGKDVMTLEDVVNERMETQISTIENKGNGQVAIKFTVDNTELTSGFFVREIGIFAKLNEGGEEKLYAYTNAGNYTNYLADNKTPIDAIITKINLAVGNAAAINFTVDKSVVYVSLEDLDTAIKNHDNSPTAHVEAITEHNNNENAHADMQGATAENAGIRGMVPAPKAGDSEKFLRGDGEWANSLTQADLLDMIYPVGSIYMSVNSTSPNILFGGTWEAMPAGRVLLAQGESEWGTTYTAGSTGGEATHQLTVGEMPSHTHNLSITTDGSHAHVFLWCWW